MLRNRGFKDTFSHHHQIGWILSLFSNFVPYHRSFLAKFYTTSLYCICLKTFHSKIISPTHVLKVLSFFLIFFLSSFYLCSLTSIFWLQARSQEFFRTGYVSWNKEASIKFYLKHTEARRHRKIFGFCSPRCSHGDLHDALKTAFQTRNRTHR